jgi:L,D-peptidoglycan transpeptidase YkuD (ErfK/YbiS/YcfS/YnhG family)
MSTKVRPKHPQLIVRRLSPRSVRGWLHYGPLRWPCALGRSGTNALKREGDGATPVGTFEVQRLYYRADVVRRFKAGPALIPLRPGQGWCDAPDDRNYNRQVPWPYPASAENLWRDDGLYDLIVVLGYNRRPRVRGRGSAIFMHIARPGYVPTEGCIALHRKHLQLLLGLLRGRNAELRVLPG